jgi:hypothetical protein
VEWLGEAEGETRMRRSGWAEARDSERECARAASRMVGRSAVRRREEKKPMGAGEEDEGGWKRPRESEREEGWEREQWPETEMESAGAGGAAAAASS